MNKTNEIYKYEGVNLFIPDLSIKYFDRTLHAHPQAKFSFRNYSQYKKQCIDLTIPVFLEFNSRKKLNPLLLTTLAVLDPLDMITKPNLNEEEIIEISKLNSGPIKKRIPDHSPIYLEFKQLNKSLICSNSIILKAYSGDSCIHNNLFSKPFLIDFAESENYNEKIIS
ncbi:hypothetical protein [Belliella aquatica]|uniref:Uncharacterized protein n=1 Tax=Belliella aquatica TaxID=1323734 RepID=A0ABQ1M9I8_9BACT|nr:hypothetical protein [Belliella aquatica]MCH7404634.1 hypothetical protein [Belliella aquatica]GGC35333.1 hypothetical protein GCM10010993_12820 [Belliella aquatica]